MSKKEDGEKNTNASSNQTGEYNVRSDKGDLGHTDNGNRYHDNFDGKEEARQQASGNQNSFHPPQTRDSSGNGAYRENGKASQDSGGKNVVTEGAQKSTNRFDSELQLETVDSEEEYDNVASVSDAIPQAATTTTQQQSVPSTKPVVVKSQGAAEADPEKLELETERYYDELLGKKEEAKKNAEVLSASQVAKITVAYKTEEDRKKDEEDLKKEEENKAKERQAQIETAWSILHQYWQFVSENPYDFNGWTYLLNHVESMVRRIHCFFF